MSFYWYSTRTGTVSCVGSCVLARRVGGVSPRAGEGVRNGTVPVLSCFLAAITDRVVDRVVSAYRALGSGERARARVVLNSSSRPQFSVNGKRIAHWMRKYCMPSSMHHAPQTHRDRTRHMIEKNDYHPACSYPMGDASETHSQLQ